jgi:hypothetical protein
MPVLHRRIKTRQRRKNRKVFSRKRKNISYSLGRNIIKKLNRSKKGGIPSNLHPDQRTGWVIQSTDLHYTKTPSREWMKYEEGNKAEAATRAARAEERAADRRNRSIVTDLDKMWIKAYEAEAKAARLMSKHGDPYTYSKHTLEAIADAKQATEEAKKAQEEVESIGLDEWMKKNIERETAREAQRAQNDAAKAERAAESKAEFAAAKAAAEKRTAERAAAVAAENSAVRAQQAAARAAWEDKEAAQKAAEKAAMKAVREVAQAEGWVDNDAWVLSQLPYRENPNASKDELEKAEAVYNQMMIEKNDAIQKFRVGFRLTDDTRWLDYLVRRERNKTSSTGSTSSTENTGTGPTGTGGRRKNKKVFSRKRKNISYSVGRNTRKKSIKRGGMSSEYFAAMEEMRRAGLLEDTQKAIAQAQADKKAGIGPYKRPDTDKTDKTEIDKSKVRKRWWRLSQIM